MIGRFQNRCGSDDGSFWGNSQSQFYYHDQIPQDFNYECGTYLPRQTSRPSILGVAPLHLPQPEALLHLPQPAAPLYQLQPAAPLHHPPPVTQLYQPRPAELFPWPRPSAPSYQPRSVAPLHQSQTPAPLHHRSQPALPLHQPQLAAPPSHQPQPAALPSHQPQPAAPPSHQPQPAAALSHQTKPALPLHQPKPAPLSHQPQPALLLHQPQPTAALSHQPKPAPPSHQPQPAPLSHQPQPAPLSHQPQPALPLHQPNPAAPPSHQPKPAAALSHQPKPALPLHQPQPTAALSHQPQPAPPSHQPQPAAALSHQLNPALLSHQPKPAVTPSHQPKPAVAPSHQPQPVPYCKICEVKLVTYKNVEMHNNGKKHRRMLELLGGLEKQRPRKPRDDSGAHGCCSFMPMIGQNPIVAMKNQQHADANYNISVQTDNTGAHGRRTFKRKFGQNQSVEVLCPADSNKNAKTEYASAVPRYCKICDVTFPKHMKLKHFEMHNNGKRHQRMLGLKRLKTSHGQSPNSQSSSIQTRTVQKSGIKGHLLKNVSSDGSTLKHKNYLQKDTEETSEVGAQGSEGKPRDNTDPQGHGFKYKIIKVAKTGKCMKTNSRVRSTGIFSKPDVKVLSNSVELLDQIPALPPQLEPVASLIIAPKGKEHEIQNPTADANDQPHVPAESDVNTQTEVVSSDSAAIAIVPPGGLIESHAFPLCPAVGSSFEPKVQDFLLTEVSESIVHHEIRNPVVETNDQSQSISMELDAPADSDIDSQTEDVSSDSAATATVPPKGLKESHTFTLGSRFAPQNQDLLVTEVPQRKVHGIQNQIVETNDQLHSISMELVDPAGSDIDCHTEDASDDSATIARAPISQVSASPAAAGSSFEPLNQCILRIETEPQLSSGVADCEGQYCTGEKNSQLLSSALVEYNAPSLSTPNTQTADGRSEAKHKMDILSNQSMITQLSKVDACLTCGDKGFPETLVFCSKCQVYALHRYCLDGPVIFTDDVTWFCEDCEPKLVNSSSPDRCVPLPSVKSDSQNLAKDASQARTSPDQCVPQPILDPVWRGGLCLPDQSFGLLAHISTLACPKVLEETKLFPEVLSVDLRQRSVVWPQSFVKSKPNEDSIALYFFPESDSVESAFDKLVDDMISSDLAIRTVVKNAELLVFPSTLLPVEHRRFEAKYYLWGVFRALKSSPNTKDAACVEDPSVLKREKIP